MRKKEKKKKELDAPAPAQLAADGQLTFWVGAH